MAKIFIVDDEPILHELYRDILSMNGHEISDEAYNGDECVNKLNNANPQPDLILMDHRMPIMNGIEATKKLLKSNPELKIIFVSADITVKEEALSMGAVEFIKKPFTISTLFKSIDNLFE